MYRQGGGVFGALGTGSTDDCPRMALWSLEDDLAAVPYPAPLPIPEEEKERMWKEQQRQALSKQSMEAREKELEMKVDENLLEMEERFKKGEVGLAAAKLASVVMAPLKLIGAYVMQPIGRSIRHYFYDDFSVDPERAAEEERRREQLKREQMEHKGSPGGSTRPGARIVEVRPGELAAGWAHTACISNEDRAVFVWGRPFDAQIIMQMRRLANISRGIIGLTTSMSRLWGDSAGVYLRPFKVASFPYRVRSVAASLGVTAVVTEEHRLYMFGANTNGVCGVDETKHSVCFAPTTVAGLDNKLVVDVQLGLSHAVALTSGGAVWTWGNGELGQLGNGKCEVRYDAQQIYFEYTEPVRCIAAGFNFSACLTESGRVYAWGRYLAHNPKARDPRNSAMPGLTTLPRLLALPPPASRHTPGTRPVHICASNPSLVIQLEDNTLLALGAIDGAKVFDEPSVVLDSKEMLTKAGGIRCIRSGFERVLVVANNGEVFAVMGLDDTTTGLSPVAFLKPTDRVSVGKYRYDVDGFNVADIACGMDSVFVFAESPTTGSSSSSSRTGKVVSP